MLSRKVVSLVCTVTFLTVLTATVTAMPVDRRVIFTFNAPVSIPGVTLPPDTYVFRVANPTMSRDVVQVLSEDGRTLYATFFTMRAALPEAPDQPEVRFLERRSDSPYAIRSWWYPGERTGFEPIYPREQALQLARATAGKVLTSRATAEALKDANSLVRVSAAGEEPVGQ